MGEFGVFGLRMAKELDTPQLGSFTAAGGDATATSASASENLKARASSSHDDA